MYFRMQTMADKACSVNFSEAQCQMSEYKQEQDEVLKSDRAEKMDNLPCDSLRERSKHESHEKAEKQTQRKREIREK